LKIDNFEKKKVKIRRRRCRQRQHQAWVREYQRHLLKVDPDERPAPCIKRDPAARCERAAHEHRAVVRRKQKQLGTVHAHEPRPKGRRVARARHSARGEPRWSEAHRKKNQKKKKKKFPPQGAGKKKKKKKIDFSDTEVLKANGARRKKKVYTAWRRVGTIVLQ
jgi:hypothetical protein